MGKINHIFHGKSCLNKKIMKIIIWTYKKHHVDYFSTINIFVWTRIKTSISSKALKNNGKDKQTMLVTEQTNEIDNKQTL